MVSTTSRTRALAIFALASLARPASAADAPSSVPTLSHDAGVLAQLKEYEARIAELEEKQRAAEQALAKPRPAPAPSVLSLLDGVRFRISSYTDVGLFKASGDGVAYVRDVGHQLHPEESGVPWVFVGDPWANTINAQGDSADLGLDRTNIPRFDPIHSHGKASFIINMVNVTLQATVGEHLFSEASLNFMPRSGLLGSPGDLFDADLAYIEWRPWLDRDFHVFVGKFESTFGIEYRQRKAPDRVEVTPSIISRYTVGTPIGLKVRGSLLQGMLTYNFALTNGGMTIEKFPEFFNETDSNNFKTLSGRLSFVHNLPFGTFEVGASGLYGAQDNQPDDKIRSWQVGADLKLTAGDLTLKAEVLRVHNPGGGIASAPSLSASGGYVIAYYQLFPWVTFFGRTDYRNARMLAFPNLYLTDDLRFTGGVRFDISFNVIAKAEYTYIRELNGLEINDNVFTSSLVFKF